MLCIHPRTLQSLAFPMLSTSIFSSNGSIYDQSAVFDSQFRLNQTALGIVGLPALTGSNAWSNLTSNLAVSLLVREKFGIRNNTFFSDCSDWWHDCACRLVLGPVCS